MRAQGNTKGAILHFQQALEIDEEVYGPDHPNVAFRACILADILHDMGGLMDARSLYRRALEIIESAYGPNHLDAAILSNNLGNIAKAQGEPAEARKRFEKALRVYRHRLGEEHPCVKCILYQLKTLE